MCCAGYNNVAEVVLCEFEDSDQSSGLLNLLRPSCGSRASRLVWMAQRRLLADWQSRGARPDKWLRSRPASRREAHSRLALR